MLDAAERAILIEAACALNEAVPPAASVPIAGTPSGRPGDDFNERGDVRELLRRHSWSLVRSGDNEYWRRPGKDWGWSATLKGRVLYVFSSNASPFEPDRAYAPFTVYTLLDHGGDFALAATALRSQGYGQTGDDTGVDLSHFVCSSAGPPSQPEYPDPGTPPRRSRSFATKPWHRRAWRRATFAACCGKWNCGMTCGRVRFSA